MCLRGYNQCWSGSVFLLDNLESITKISHYLIPVGYTYFSVCIYCTMQEYSNLGNNAPVSI